MCDIWKIKKPCEVDFNDFKKILKNSDLQDVRAFSLTGGEPFLYNNLVEVARLITDYYPNVLFFIPSTGFLTDRIVEMSGKISKFADLTVGVSIDGMRDSHDKVRGISGGFNMATKTLQKLNDKKIKTLLSFTITPENSSELKRVYELGEKIGVGSFCCRPAGTGIYFKNEGKNYELSPTQRESVLFQLEEIDYADSLIIEGVHYFLKSGRHRYPCTAGYFSLFISTNLDVYPCTHCQEDWTFGNLRQADFSINKITNCEKAKCIRKKFVDKCSKCLNDVEYSTTYSMQFFDLARWLLKRKGLRWCLERIK